MSLKSDKGIVIFFSVNEIENTVLLLVLQTSSIALSECLMEMENHRLTVTLQSEFMCMLKNSNINVYKILK